MVDIVSSRAKAEILRLLFGLRPPELHLRELARQSGLSLGTIQQELKRLVGAGLVLARRDGNRVYYQANREHPVHGELRGLVLKTDGLAGVLERALQDPGTALAFVFGSIASGEARAGSDIDLFVVGSLGLRRLAKLLSGVAEELGREINPHVMTADEFRDRKSGRDHFLAAVLESPKLFVIGTQHELDAMGE
jgi:predicted nucleotidyltransferase